MVGFISSFMQNVGAAALFVTVVSRMVGYVTVTPPPILVKGL